MRKPLAIAIMGPTASGKSEVAERLASALGTRIVNADAFQVYKGFDIGTAKPLHREQYDLVDILEPTDSFSVGRFINLAGPIMTRYEADGQDAVVCGGSGLYVRALFEGYQQMKGADPDLRVALKQDLDTFGIDGVLEREGVSRAELSHDLQKNRQRLLRFLEKRRMPSEPRDGISWRSDRLKFAIDIGRDELVCRIEARIRRMVDNGWREEVGSLLDRGVPLDAPAFRAIGYRQMTAVVSGSLSMEDAIGQIEIATRQYAKRQLTWLRREPQLHWVDGQGGTKAVVDHIMQSIGEGKNG